jgi:ParB family chromosome partitioning protein
MEVRMTQGAKRYQKGKLYDLSIAELRPDPEQPRKYFDEQALSELKASIAKHGVLQPLLVRRAAEGGFLVVSGERRYQASLQAGLASVPVLITDGDPVEISIVENLLRENLTAVEEAEAIDRLKSQHNYQLADLSAVLGKAESTLSEILSINKLPSTVKDDCRNDPKAARYILVEIAKQHDAAKMASLYQKYKESGLTRGEIRSKERLLRSKEPMVDISFLGVCLKKLNALEMGKLDQPQVDRLTEELENLRLAAQAKLEILKPPPATGA